MRRSPRHRDYKAEYFAKRDPMQEFFQLTCKSIILSSPQMNTICTVNTNELYKKALKQNVPFFKWASWIDDFLNKEFLRQVIRNSKKSGKKQTKEKSTKKSVKIVEDL